MYYVFRSYLWLDPISDRIIRHLTCLERPQTPSCWLCPSLVVSCRIGALQQYYNFHDEMVAISKVAVEMSSMPPWGVQPELRFRVQYKD